MEFVLQLQPHLVVAPQHREAAGCLFLMVIFITETLHYSTLNRLKTVHLFFPFNVRTYKATSSHRERVEERLPGLWGTLHIQSAAPANGTFYSTSRLIVIKVTHQR